MALAANEADAFFDIDKIKSDVAFLYYIFSEEYIPRGRTFRY